MTDHVSGFAGGLIDMVDLHANPDKTGSSSMEERECEESIETVSESVVLAHRSMSDEGDDER